MITVLYGNNREKIFEEMKKIRDIFLSIHTNGTVVVCDGAKTEQEIEQLLRETSLFGEKQFIIFDSLKESLLLLESFLRESIHDIVILEEGLLKKEKDFFASLGATIFEYKQQSKKEGPFAFADAVGNRDKKQAWILFHEYIRNGTSPEELNGILFWQIKSMLLALHGETPEKAGLSPFVYQKSKKFLEKWEEDELETFLHSIVSTYHRAREKDGGEFSVLFEKLILEAL